MIFIIDSFLEACWMTFFHSLLVFIFCFSSYATLFAEEPRQLTELEQLEYQCFDLKRQGKDEEVYVLCTNALKKNPNSGMLYYWRGSTKAYGIKNSVPSLDDLEKAIQLGGKHLGDAYYEKARILYQEERYTEASQAAIMAHRSQCKNRQLRRLRCSIAAGNILKNVDGIETWRAAFRIKDFIQQEMYGEGIIFADQVLDIYPNSAEVLFEKAQIQSDARLFKQALHNFDLASTNGYKYIGKLYYAKAVCYNHLGYIDKAMKTVELAIDNGYEQLECLQLRQEIQKKLENRKPN